MSYNYNYITNRTSPNKTIGGNSIKYLTIHWWDDPAKNPSAEGVVNWLCNPASGVSAHLVATGTGRRVWHLVNNSDRAWHAGTQGNAQSIGIELDPRCRPEDYDVAAEVIANLWRYYGKLPLVGHNFWTTTRCPGGYSIPHLYSLAEQKLNPKPTPPPVPVTKPVPASEKLPAKLQFTAKLAATQVWDLTTNPNYKSVKTLKGGETFTAYAQIKFNDQIYYVTEYAHGKGNKHGVNARDLTPVPVPPKPTPEPEKPVPPVAALPGYEDLDVRLTKLEALVETIANFLTSIFNNFKRG